MAKKKRDELSPRPKNISKEIELEDPSRTTEPVGQLGNYVGQEFHLKGVDGSGGEVEWIIRPTGANSFEMVVPENHELGHPEAWENISILAQRVTCKSGSCGCDGNQCGCQGINCASNCTSQGGRLRLISKTAFDINRVNELKRKLGLPRG